MFEMRFYWWVEKRKIVVQNCVMDMMGQKHIHTKKEFEQWKKNVPPESLIHIESRQ